MATRGATRGATARATSEVNRFNAETVAGKRGLPLVQILKEFAQSHRRVVEFIQGTAEVHFARETPFRQRLRWDTYSHYREHARAIRAWRDARGV